MDMSAIQSSLQASLSMAILNKSMQRDAQSIDMLAEMAPDMAAMAQLATKIGGMDIRV